MTEGRQPPVDRGCIFQRASSRSKKTQKQRPGVPTVLCARPYPSPRPRSWSRARRAGIGPHGCRLASLQQMRATPYPGSTLACSFMYSRTPTPLPAPQQPHSTQPCPSWPRSGTVCERPTPGWWWGSSTTTVRLVGLAARLCFRQCLHRFVPRRRCGSSSTTALPLLSLLWFATSTLVVFAGRWDCRMHRRGCNCVGASCLPFPSSSCSSCAVCLPNMPSPACACMPSAKPLYFGNVLHSAHVFSSFPVL